MATRIELVTGAGEKHEAALAEPERAQAPGLILVHEWWGLNDDMRQLADRFAQAGFLSLAVDLYGGEVTGDAARAMELSNQLRTPDALKIVQAAADLLRAHPKGNGKVGVTGFCLGGAMALAAACNVSGLSAVVPFYGLPRAEYADWTKAKAPILGHFGLNDPVISVERVRAAHEAAVAAGAAFELCLYDAGHAFMRQGDAGAYHAESAERAWARSVEFLRKELG